MKDTDGRLCLNVAEVLKIIAERRAEREKTRPTPELLIAAAKLIELLVATHPQCKDEAFDGPRRVSDAVYIGGQDWKHIVRQLCSGAAYMRRHVDADQ